ncbi:MAG: DNA polymerase subunit beta, partial [Deltaproteobacteria bacterium]|nr:DNA polymerase subunit beta [Deltaproteobacteria bacterium]
MKIKELKEKREQILAIAERYGAQRIQLFGSSARGES